jgi:hypothetical protein
VTQSPNEGERVRGFLAEIRTHLLGDFLGWLYDKSVKEDTGGIPGITYRISLYTGPRDDPNPCPKIWMGLLTQWTRVDRKVKTRKPFFMISLEYS